MVRRLLAALASVVVVMSMAGPVRAEPPTKRQRQLAQLTPYVTPTEVSAPTRGPGGATCRVMHKGVGFTNGFNGKVSVLLVGNLRWCWVRGRVTGGEFWMNVRQCCGWRYQGLVHQEDRGCFNGCKWVHRHRRGEFKFFITWPGFEGTVHPWVTLSGDGFGRVREANAGGA